MNCLKKISSLALPALHHLYFSRQRIALTYFFQKN